MSKHIEHIEIKNFKSIRHQVIEGCKRVNVFIGYPNVGKSNILEALAGFGLLGGGDGSNPSLEELVRVDKMNELFFENNVATDASVFLDHVEGIEYRYQDKLHIGFSYHAADLDVPVGLLAQEGEVPYALTLDKAVRPAGRSKKAIAANGQGVIVKFYKFQKDCIFSGDKGLSLLAPFGENLLDIIQFNEPLKEFIIQEGNRYGLKVLFDPIEHKLSFYKEKEGGVLFKIPYHQVADTLRRLFFFKAAVLSNSESVLLFEEPEAHLFTPYISKLTSDILFDVNHNQYFITTHSSVVVNDFMENLKNDELAIYVAGFKNETGETVVRRLNETEMSEIYQYGIDIYFNMENYLEHEQ